jgi:hypothetical protein
MSESFRLASSIQAASGTRESVVVLIDVMNAGIWKELCENAWSFIFAVNKREQDIAEVMMVRGRPPGLFVCPH